MKRLLRFALVIIAATLVLFVVGCVSTSVGTKMSADKVDQLKKGVTTRAEVERLFGKPIATSMLGDGRRMMVYNYSETKVKPTGLGATIGSAFVPGGYLFMGGGAKGEHEQQTLQIVLSKDGIVEDFEWNDTASVTQSSGGLLTQQTTTTPVPPSSATNR